MFIATLTYTAPMSEIEANLADHRAFLDEHYASGALLASGPKNPRTGGVILAITPDRVTLDAILAEDPFQVRGLAQYDVVEFVAVKFAADLPERIKAQLAG